MKSIWILVAGGIALLALGGTAAAVATTDTSGDGSGDGTGSGFDLFGSSLWGSSLDTTDTGPYNNGSGSDPITAFFGDSAMTTSGGAQYTQQQIEQLWIQNGGDPNQAATAAAVAMAESSGQSGAINDKNANGSIDRGLFQINSVHGSLSTTDVNANVKAAIAISNNGQNWAPWVTYNSGAYLNFLG